MLLAALLVAFLWQSVVTATHLHFAPGTFTAASANADQALQLTAPKTPGELPINCPLCHGAAIAGHFLSPGTASLTVPIAAAPWRQLPIPFVVRGDVARSHAWRSRAPPAPAIA